MDYIVEQFKALAAIASPTGFTRAAAEYAMHEFRRRVFEATLTNKGCVLVDFGGEGDALVYSAHLDTLGCMVAEIKSTGALRLTRIGGMNANNAEAE